jgi:hypothetical protein
MLRRIFGPKRDCLSEKYEKLHTEELHSVDWGNKRSHRILMGKHLKDKMEM